MNQYGIFLPGHISIALQTQHNLTQNKEALLQFGAYIPGFNLNPNLSAQYSACVTHEIGNADYFSDNNNHIQLTTTGPEDFPADLYHLFYGVTRREFLKAGIYPTHAACIGKNGHYSLIVGHSGSGKTSLASSFLQNKDVKLFSGNKTALTFKNNNLLAVAGTRTMTALDNELHRYAYELPDNQYAEESEVRIASIYIVKINDGVEEHQNLSPLAALHTVYPYFMDSVNADIIIGGRHILNNSSSIETKEKLVSNLVDILQQIPVHKVSGSIPYMRNEITL